MISALELVVGLIVLTLGADLLVRGSVTIASWLKVPHLIVGLTIVAFGTSAPELVVSLNAALEGSGGIAIGNIVGSNIANILIVLGLPSIIRATNCQASGATRNLAFMILVTLVFIFMIWDGTLTRIDGFVLLALFAGFFVDQIFCTRRHRRGCASNSHGEEHTAPASRSLWIASAYVLVGLVCLPFAADAVVDGAMGIARMFAISETAIGVTIVALGTSLPELATSLMAARRGHTAMAIGNAIGSNIFNILAIMGVTAAIVPIAVPADFFSFEVWMMVAAAFFIVPFVVWCIPISRLTGTVMTLAYAATMLVILGGTESSEPSSTIHRAETPILR
ncbi:MAG: calcium/sodium antiporter [Alphaproteobacteria bacterium]